MNVVKIALVEVLFLAGLASLAHAQVVDRSRIPTATQPDSALIARAVADAREAPRAKFFLLGAGAGAMMLVGGLGFDRGEGEPQDAAIVLSAATVLTLANFITATQGPRYVPPGLDAGAYTAAWRREATARRRTRLWVGSATGVAGMFVFLLYVS